MMSKEGEACLKILLVLKLILLNRWWADGSMNFPPPKSQGRTVMTSDFCTILDGFLDYNDEEWDKIKDTPEVKSEIGAVGERRARRSGCVLDVSSQGYYNTERCIPDFEKVFNPRNFEGEIMFSVLGCKDYYG